MTLVTKPFGDIITFTRSTTGTYFDAAGVLQTAAIDAPRLDYDPLTLLPRGLLIEEQRTNLLTYSEQFDNGIWGKAGITVTPNAVVAPDGAVSADKIVESAASGSHQIFSGTKSISGGKASLSVFLAKQPDSRLMAITIRRDGEALNLTTTFSYVDALTGTVTFERPGFATTVSAIGDSWWRVSVVATGIVSTAEMFIRTAAVSGNTSYTGDGTSGIYIWGAQLEAGAFPTSYIPTEASQVTRAADIASVNTLSPWFNASEGTLFVDTSAAPGSDGGNIAASLSAGTGAEYMYSLLRTNVNANRIFTVRDDNVQRVGIDINTPIGDVRAAVAYKLNDFAASANGSPATLDTSGTVPTPTSLQIGRLNGSLYWNGHIRSLRYWPRRLTNELLSEITA